MSHVIETESTPAAEKKTAVRAVKSIMTRPAFPVRADLSLESLEALFLERGLSRVPVADEDGRVVGIVTKTDLVREHNDVGDNPISDPAKLRRRNGVEEPLSGAHVHGEPRTVADVMTRNPITVAADAPIWFAAALMSDRGVHGLPVVKKDGRLLGMISALDVARWAANHK